MEKILIPNEEAIKFEMITFAHGSVDETGIFESDYCYIITKEPMTSKQAGKIIEILNKQNLQEPSLKDGSES